MNIYLQKFKNQADKLSVSDHLELVSAIIESLSRELRPRKPLPKDFVEQMIGIGKGDAPPPTDAEVEAMRE
ncbi:MAG: hypothetical protein AB4426_06700 [Xenococcaceae cyanobacterium]